MTTNLNARLSSSPLTYRTIQADDMGRLRRMFERCSRVTIYRRFFCAYPTAIPDRLLQRLTYVDYVNRHAVVAVVDDEIVGMASFDKVGAGDEADVAICVEDAWQRNGVGRALLDWLADLALRRGVATLTADVQADNRAACALVAAVLPGAQLTLQGTTYAVRAVL
ncbi:MAG TPA: GNAT family N-acetyltransferase [Mycobacteriales bacterium]|nr:GNAT family N-acetyltransferase [Mycobacteriales bacterium]